MTIINHLNRSLFKFLIISFFIISCNSQRVAFVQEKENCLLIEADLTEFKISSNNSELANSEFKNFFESVNKYDVLRYSGKGGEVDYRIDRWYYKTENIFFHIRILNGIKTSTEIHLKESDIELLFEKLDSKSYSKVCSDCYDCANGIFMAKNEEKFFKYNYDGVFNSGLGDAEKERIIKAIDVLNFFSNQ